MSRTILTGARVLDGDSLHPGKTIVIEGANITSVQNAVPSDLGSQDQVIDLTGKVVMPGMCIGHFHPEYNGLGTFDAMPLNLGVERPAGVTMAYAIRNMRIAIEAGFTSALGTASLYDIDVCLEMAMAEKVVDGPRIVPCSPHLMSTGSHSPQTPWWLEARNLGLDQGQCTGPWEFRRFIREQTAKGVRMIKIFPTGGHGLMETRGKRNLTPEELQACVDTAHERGAWIRAHAVYADDVIEAIEAGVDIIDHADDLDDRMIEAMVKHGTYYCPTIGMTIATIRWKEGDRYFDFMKYYPTDERYITHFGAQLRKAQEAGIKMLIGDDYGPKYGFFPNLWGDEMGMFLKEMQFTPAQVLAMVTRNGSHFFGDATGEIAAGKLADLLVLAFDPLAEGFDQFATPETGVLAVMKDGEFVKNRLAS